MSNLATKVVGVFGTKAVTLAMRSGISPMDIAAKASISDQRWREISSGAEQPTQNEIVSLAEAMDLSRRSAAIKSTLTVADLLMELRTAAALD